MPIAAESPVAVNRNFKVVRLDLPLDGATFDSMLGAETNVTLTVGQPHGAPAGEASSWQALSSAHAYHVSSARDDLPRPWFVAAPLLQRCPELLVVSSYGAGYDTVDVNACTAAGVCVVNQAGSNAGAVAEHAFGLILGLSRRIGECDRRLRRGEKFTRLDGVGTDLDGRTLGIVGIGHAGRRVAQLARAFGMTVLACDPFVGAAEIRARGAEPVTLTELLERADVVSLHCPLDAGSAGMFDAAAFAAMRPGALFVTTARGGIHDEDALFAALTRGHLGGAGLDVWLAEPPAADHPLLSLDNVLATHHIAGVTHGSRRQMASMAASQLIAVARGERPPRLINPQVWPAFLVRFERAFGKLT